MNPQLGEVTGPFPGDSDLAARMRRFDWTSTPLGSPATWPHALSAAVRIVLTSRYAMWMSWGPQRTMLYNDAYAVMTLGKKHPWALGRPADEVWAEIWSQIGPRIDRVMASGEATWDERLLLFLERSGYPEETYHTFSYSPLADDHGTICGHLCVVTEETGRVIDERRLAALKELGLGLSAARTDADVARATEDASDAAAEDLPFLLLYLLDEGNRLRVAGARGVPAEVVTAPPMPVAEFAGHWTGDGEAAWDEPCDQPSAAPPDVAGWATRPWSSPITRVLRVPLIQPGQTRALGVLMAGVNPHRDVDEQYAGFVSLFASQVAAGLANVRAAEEDRRRARALAELDRAKSAFFSNVSHEFRTPLTLMLGPTQDAVQATDGVLQGDDLAMVYRNQMRLLKLVNTLLDFSRLEAGAMTTTLTPVDLAALTADLAASFRAAIERGGLTFHVSCPPLGQLVAVDAGSWEKVVLNLLSNALKFTLEGEIWLSLRLDGGHAVLSVRDTGVGISADDLPTVFERFRRIEGTHARTHEGTGIGLALAQDLVHLHGGTIEVESTPGVGSTFTVRVPAGATTAAGAPPLPAPPSLLGGRVADGYVIEAERWLPGLDVVRRATAHDAMPSPPDPRGLPLVLVADDNADMRDYATRLLLPHWRVTTAGDGREALAAVQALRPDLVLTDVMMPGIDGFALLDALKGNPDTAATPVIMLSARAGQEAHASALEAGADDYVVKPFSARELIARVAIQLAHAEARRQVTSERDRMFGLLRDLPAVVNYLAGPNLVWSFVHPRTTELLGGRDVLGMPLLEAMPEHRSQPFLAELLDVLNTGRIHSGRAARAYINSGTGEPARATYWDYTYLPVRGAGGAIEGVMTFDLEVTDQVIAQQRLEHATRAKDEFLAMLGHELRNPLAPIVTAVQLIKLKGVTAVERERTIIERQAAHLVRLVDDLLDVSRIARGKFELRRALIEVSKVVGQAVEQSSPLLEARAQHLTVDVPAIGLLVDGDPARLAQAVANLLTNAAKYSERHTTITLTAWRDGPEVALSVRDHGMGIDAEMLPRVFDMFVQEGQALDRSQGGLGLGLSIVRNVMALHGGTVSVSSDGRGHGAEFTLRLPAATAAGVGGGEDAVPVPMARPGRGISVLVVDDNEDARALIADILEAHGYRVVCAADGPSALRAVDRDWPDAGVLDIGLPGMDGYELAVRLQERAGKRPIALLALTGYAAPLHEDRATQARYQAHLVKPVDASLLLDELRRLVPAPGQGPASPRA